MIQVGLQHALDEAQLVDLVHKVGRQLALAPKLGRGRRERLLRLAIKRRVDNHRLDKDHQVLLDVGRLDRDLLLLLDGLAHLLGNLVGNVVDVLAALDGPDAIDKRHLLEAVGAERDAHLPTRAENLAKGPIVRLGKQRHIGRQVLDRHHIAVVRHRQVLAAARRQVVRALLNELKHRRRPRRHPEPLQVGNQLDVRIRLARVFDNRGRVNRLHIVLKHLGVLLFGPAVDRLNLEAVRENVGELCAKAVLAARELVALVVVGRCEQVAENELDRVHLVLRVHGNVNAVAVVADHQLRRLGIDRHFNARDELVQHALGQLLLALGLHCQVLVGEANALVPRIHNELVENLVQTRNVVGLFESNRAIGLKQENLLVNRFRGANVAVRQIVHVLTLRLLDVLLGNGRVHRRLHVRHQGSRAGAAGSSCHRPCHRVSGFSLHCRRHTQKHSGCEWRRSVGWRLVKGGYWTMDDWSCLCGTRRVCFLL